MPMASFRDAGVSPRTRNARRGSRPSAPIVIMDFGQPLRASVTISRRALRRQPRYRGRAAPGKDLVRQCEADQAEGRNQSHQGEVREAEERKHRSETKRTQNGRLALAISTSSPRFRGAAAARQHEVLAHRHLADMIVRSPLPIRTSSQEPGASGTCRS
jgi:hypothetical protein